MLAALSLLGNDLRQGSAKKALTLEALKLGKEEVLVIRKKGKIKRNTSQKTSVLQIVLGRSSSQTIFSQSIFPGIFFLQFSRWQ
jgi:hypothetical protein